MNERKNAAPDLRFRKAGPGDLPAVRRLIGQYMESLGLDLCFQGIDEELATLPGKYAEPEGALIVALADGEVCGCVALRSLGSGFCEMKRLYVAEGRKGLGLGRGLVAAILAEARARGYGKMRLDTLRRMEAAISLYRSFGFRETSPYVYNPIEGAVFMEKDLGAEP